MSTKVVVCLSCQPTEGTDADGNPVNVWTTWDHGDVEGIKQHQSDKPDHLLTIAHEG